MTLDDIKRLSIYVLQASIFVFVAFNIIYFSVR
jgi:hypothetical protein